MVMQTPCAIQGFGDLTLLIKDKFWLMVNDCWLTGSLIEIVIIIRKLTPSLQKMDLRET